MMTRWLALVALLAGCATDGRGLMPGQSTEADVLAAMGAPKERRTGTTAGETVLWFPRLPHGRASYAARIGADGRLIGVEQRLTRENLNRLKPDMSQESDVRDLLGPPYAVEVFSRQERRVWTYPTQGLEAQLIIVQFSADGFLREAYMIDDPDLLSLGE
jgi:hypothetical protein